MTCAEDNENNKNNENNENNNYTKYTDKMELDSISEQKSYNSYYIEPSMLNFIFGERNHKNLFIEWATISERKKEIDYQEHFDKIKSILQNIYINKTELGRFYRGEFNNLSECFNLYFELHNIGDEKLIVKYYGYLCENILYVLRIKKLDSIFDSFTRNIIYGTSPRSEKIVKKIKNKIESIKHPSYLTNLLNTITQAIT